MKKKNETNQKQPTIRIRIRIKRRRGNWRRRIGQNGIGRRWWLNLTNKDIPRFGSVVIDSDCRSRHRGLTSCRRRFHEEREEEEDEDGEEEEDGGGGGGGGGRRGVRWLSSLFGLMDGEVWQDA